MTWQRTSTVAAAVSSLLCIATGALWVRSYFAGDSIRREAREVTPEGRHVIVTSLDCYHGLMHVERERWEFTQPWDGHAYRRFRPKWSWTSGGYTRQAVGGPGGSVRQAPPVLVEPAGV